MFESRRVHALLSTIYVLNWVARSAKLAKLSAGRFLAERISPLKSLKTGTVNDAKGAVSVFADLIQEDQDPLLSVGIDAHHSFGNRKAVEQSISGYVTESADRGARQQL